MGVSSSTLMWKGYAATCPIASPHTRLGSRGRRSYIYAHLSCSGTTPRSILLNSLYHTHSYISVRLSDQCLCLCSQSYHPYYRTSVSIALILDPSLIRGSLSSFAALLAHGGMGALTTRGFHGLSPCIHLPPSYFCSSVCYKLPSDLHL